MIQKLFDAALAYYALVVAFAAASGVRDTLRSGGKPPAPATPATRRGRTRPARYPNTSIPGRRGGAPAAGTLLGYVREFAATAGWATGFGLVLGWLTGAEVYRGGRRATIAIAARVRDRRSKPGADAEDAGQSEPDATAEEETEPTPGDTAPQTQNAPPIPAAAPATDSGAADPAPAPPPPATAPSLPSADPDDEPLDDSVTAAPSPTVRPVAGERHLFLVTDRITAVKERETPMAAGEITDIPTLMTWTKQTAGIAEMEAVDAGCVARDAVASVEFCQETVARIAGEIRALNMTISIMRMLGVDRTTLAAYEQQLERLKVYHDATVRVADACAQLAGAASSAQLAAVAYQDSAETSLRVVVAHQMPHLEAAQATGHSGAHGAVYGAEDTRSGNALPPGR